MKKVALLVLSAWLCLVAPAFVCADEALMQNQAATGDGVWLPFNLHGFRTNGGTYSVHITGITSATVSVRGANVGTIPANNTHHIELGSCTADCILAINVPVKWIKVRVTVWASGTISAYGQ